MHAALKDHKRHTGVANESEYIRSQLAHVVDLCMAALFKALLVTVKAATPRETTMRIVTRLGIVSVVSIILRVAEALFLDRLQVIRQRGHIMQLALLGMPCKRRNIKHAQGDAHAL